MIKRYHITLGATTSAGGTVTSASSLMSVDGARIALDGDKVFCKACNSDGFIKPDGPRLNESFEDRQVALSDDLCICKCNQPPRLVNIQTIKAQWIDAAWQASRAGTDNGTAAKPGKAERNTAEQNKMPLLLRDPDTREPFKQRPYRLDLTDKSIEGTTDQNGFTRPLTAKERAAVVTWHVDGDSASA